MSSDLLSQGLTLLVFGMSTVFIFLTVLVFATAAMSAVIARYFPDPQPDGPVNNQSDMTAAAAQQDTTLKAVIGAAISKYRSQHKR